MFEPPEGAPNVAAWHMSIKRIRASIYTHNQVATDVKPPVDVSSPPSAHRAICLRVNFTGYPYIYIYIYIGELIKQADDNTIWAMNEKYNNL